ncbi:MFS transporter [Chitinasiproducens palmae]|uniref:D-galactonate transporter n=1 Tax=Chitinasiproducens palmae TaxID=1770053 RepID=A0A1H2PKB0_9BURK|nr:MFS transporter [Chitinasiproducens palmae]SDV46881.1 D-galactonate transporter [Chitinasiproducens palmae]
MTHLSDTMPVGAAAAGDVYRKITWRIMPFIVLCYVCAYLDRVNVGFAKLQMLSDLGFSDAVYGFGAGIFFIGYFFFEVPSNLILHRVGARRWIARIMVSWAVISALTLFVKTPTQFYIVRFLLGVAEAGFSPGIMLYLTYWFPAKKRGFALGLYYIAIPLAGVVGGPLSGWILSAFAGSSTMAAWQWLFLLEAVPALLAGVAVLRLMVDRPQQAKWLSDAEKTAVTQAIDAEDASKTTHSDTRAFLSDVNIWKLCAVYFCQIIGLYGISFWLPSIIKDSGLRDVATIGWLSALPYLVAIPVIVYSGISADRFRSRRMHFSVALTIGAVGFALSGYVGQNVALAVVCLCVAAAGILSGLSLFWGMPSAFLAGTSAAAGIAGINCVGNLAGFVSPYMVGWLNVTTHDNRIGLYAVAILMVVGAVAVRAIPGRLADR